MSEQPVTCLPPPLPPKTKSRRPFQENAEETEQITRNTSNNSDKDEILISASYSSRRDHQKSSRSSAITTVNLNTVDLNIPDGFQELTYSCKNSGKSHVVKILINPEETRLVNRGDEGEKNFAGLVGKDVINEVPAGETCIRISVNNNSEVFHNNNMVDAAERSSPSHYFFNQFNGLMSSGQMSPSDTLDSGTCSDLDGTSPPLTKNKSGSGVSVTLIGLHKKTASLSSGADIDSDDNESHSSTSSISCDSLNCGKVSRIETKLVNGSKSKSSIIPQTLLQDIRQRKEPFLPSLVDEKPYEDRQKEASLIENQKEIHTFDSDMFYDFHLNEKDNDCDIMPIKSVIEDETFAGYKDLLGGDSTATIRSAKGTVRGVKNRVRAGIATFLQIHSTEKVLIYLWYIGHQTASFRDVGDRFNITISSVNRVINRLTLYLSNLAPEVIKWPNEAEKRISEEHFRRNGFPNVIGAIDGCHLKLDKPEHDPDSYINRKGYYSMQSYKEKDGGKVVVYTTTMGIIRDTYQACMKVKQILRTLLVKFEERDVFMSTEYQNEIRERMKCDQILVPQVYIDGQHCGDAETVERLNESGELRKFLKPYKSPDVCSTCQMCGGYRLLPCGVCNGSKKSVHRNHFTTEFVALKCMNCDENGLEKCSAC